MKMKKKIVIYLIASVFLFALASSPPVLAQSLTPTPTSTIALTPTPTTDLTDTIQPTSLTPTTSLPVTGVFETTLGIVAFGIVILFLGLALAL